MMLKESLSFFQYDAATLWHWQINPTLPSLTRAKLQQYGT